MDKRKLAAAVSGLVLVGGLSVGAAWAQASGSAPTTSQRQAGQQETKGAEEPGDEKLPGGGHADPEGQNVDHQFEGVE